MSEKGSWKETGALISTSWCAGWSSEVQKVFSHCSLCQLMVQSPLLSHMLNSTVLNFKKQTHLPSAFQSNPTNTQWRGICDSHPGRRVPLPFWKCVASARENRGRGSLGRQHHTHLEGVHGSSGHLKGSRGLQGRLDRGSAAEPAS